MEAIVPEGYKQTKVGLIPNNWQFITLNDISLKVTDGTHKTPLYQTSGIVFVSAKNIINGQLNFNDVKYISAEEHKLLKKRCNPQTGDILLTKSGSLGDSTVIETVDFEFSIFESLALIKVKKGVNSYYINHFINSEYSKKHFYSITSGLAVKHLHLIDLRKTKIPLPPLKEQEKIAEILTTWDEAITKQEELIKAKELQKKALMQKLLSGEIRFSGFSGEWEEVRLGEIGEFKKGEQLNKDTLDIDGDFPVINGGIEPSGYTEEWNTEANTITISEGGNSCGYVNYLQDRFWSGGHCYTLLNLKIDKIYLYQFLKYNQNNIMKLRVGSGLPNIQKSAIEKFIINKPLIEEQQKIAEVLSLSDDEINLLKNELKELKLQKKALMQKLLTGQVRVKV